MTENWRKNTATSLTLTLPLPKGGHGKFFALFPYVAGRDAFLPELRSQPVLIGGYSLSLNLLARSGLP
jgi:hypothetical protein